MHVNMSNGICSENRGETEEDAFLKSFYLAPWQESNIHLDIQVHLRAIIMCWVIVSDDIPPPYEAQI